MSVSWSSWLERLSKKAPIPVMDGIVGVLCGCDQEFRVQNPVFPVTNIVQCYRVHVMNKKTVVNLVTGDTQIATIITHNDVVSSAFPLGGSVK